MDNVLFVIRGIPGSGKSTLAAMIADTHWEADMYFDRFHAGVFSPKFLKGAHEWCKERVQESLEAGVNKVAVANTFTQMWEMETYFELAEEMGYMCVVIIAENHHGNGSVHNVPQEAIDKMTDRFEVYL